LTPPAKTEAVFDYLRQCAAQMRNVTYGELADAAKLAPTRIGYQLGYIRDEICRKRGLPWLNAIAVSKATWRPGESFLPQGVAIERDEEHMWRGMVL
jgi:hypothetical protein